MIDVSRPVPGPYRMPRDGERRCRVYLEKHHQDCVDLCEVHHDIGEYTDATMRLIVASWEMRELLKRLVVQLSEDDGGWGRVPPICTEAQAILAYIEKG